MIRTSTAIWNGSLKEGFGHISSKSNIFKDLPYTWSSRFANGTETNPEELVAAAHAACFSMALSAELGKVGIVPESIETSANINLENGSIISSQLLVKANVPGISRDILEKCASEAKTNCPVSKVLSCIINMEITQI
jgi:lipoyl-dependent peroxiredoxin